MADAEKLLRILPRVKGIHYHGLVLNPKGLSRAMLAGLDFVEISSSASNTHSLQNTGMPRRKAFNRARDMVILAQKNNLRVRAGIQCAFGYLSTADIPPSRVFKMVQDYTALGVDMLILADTTGMATPLSISRMLRRMHPFSVPVGLHLHDTRGLGPVNVMAGLKAGVVRFDTALGGMGGCPFIPGAAGNISTEDTLHLLHAHNMETGVDIAAVAACSRTLEKYFGKRFSGKVHRLT